MTTDQPDGGKTFLALMAFISNSVHYLRHLLQLLGFS